MDRRIPGASNGRAPDPNLGAAPPETTVRFSIDVRAPVEHTFRVFSERIDAWWSRDHHVGTVPMAAAILEPRAGGRWYELGVDGGECDWGVVLAFDRPRHVALSWHLDGEFQYDPDPGRASRVDIWFEPTSDGGTRVTLEHSGLDRHGDTWRRLRERITRGWPIDLRRLAAAAAAGQRSTP